MYRLAFSLFLACLLPLAATANPQERAKVVTPFLDEQTIMVCRLDLTRINVNQAIEQLKPFLIGFEGFAAQARPHWESGLRAFREAGGKELYIITSLNDFDYSPFLFIVPLTEGVQADKLALVLKGNRNIESTVRNNSLVVASGTILEQWKTRQAVPRPEVAQAFAATDEAALQVLYVPPAHFKRVVEENLPKVSLGVASVASNVLTDGIRWAAFSVDVSPDLRIKLVCQSKDAAAAQALRDWLPLFWKHLGSQRGVKETIPQFEQMAATLVPEVKENRLTLNVDVPRLTKLWNDAAPLFRRQAQRQLHLSNLRQLGIAIHNYHADFDCLPRHAIYSKEGKPLLSWRVMLLPYIEHDHLYKQFKLDEPWDSEHNKKLLPLMPKLYMIPGVDAPAGHTFYQVVVTPADYKGKYETVFKADPEQKQTLGKISIQDGTSNTLLIVEASTAVPWTKPEDVVLPADNQPLPAFGAKPGEKMFGACFCDGSVRELRRSFKDQEFHQLLLRQLMGVKDGRYEDYSPLYDRDNEPSAKPNTQGRVKQVSNEGLVRIDFVQEHGLKRGDTLEIYGSQPDIPFHGRLQVNEAQPKIVVGKLIQGSVKDVQIDDLASREMPKRR